MAIATNTDVVAEWYNNHVDLEEERLVTAKLEFTITMATMNEVLKVNNVAKYRILDAGCGTGRYAIALAKEGHSVYPLDISSALVQRTSENSISVGVHLKMGVVASATDLTDIIAYRGLQFDAVLMLGPMYHLLGSEERQKAILGAIELLKPGGFLFTSFVTKFAHFRDLVSKDPGRLLREKEFYESYIEDGLYTRSGRSAFHTEPHDIVALFERMKPRANLLKLVSCEGFLGYHAATALNNLEPPAFDAWVKLILESASREDVLGSADHVLAVAQKAN
jgi:S-adenosylmethionine-dependent methyltransferase